MDKHLYYYKAKVTAVYDGDTCTVDIDVGMNIIVHHEKIRLFGINAPEMRGPEKAKGKISRDKLRELILNKEIYLETIKDKKGKYGRYLGNIWIKLKNQYFLVNDYMVQSGLAEYREY